MIPVLLTASITPNAIYTEHLDIKKRKKEYIDSINFYKKFSKVYFIENTDFNIFADDDFPKDDNIIYVSINNRSNVDWIKGKGYQEFRMIDEFVKNHLIEDDFIKVTGRYIFKNFKKLYEEAVNQRNSNNLITLIDLYNKKKCNVQIFYISKDTYLKKLYGCYEDIDDSKNNWAEHVIFRKMILAGNYKRFNRMPITEVLSGSTGNLYKTNSIRIVFSNIIRLISKSKKVLI